MTTLVTPAAGPAVGPAPLPGSAGDTSPAWLRRRDLGGGVQLRQAWPEEYPEAEDLLVAAFTTGCWVSPGYEAGLRTLAERSVRHHVWVAAETLPRDDRLLAVVLTPRAEHLGDGPFTFSILAVHPAARGRRLGEALVRHALDLARAHGHATVEIHSSPQMSEAHRLYYRLGFRRRIDDEIVIVSEFAERLLTLTYRLPDPLPPGQAVAVAAAPPGAVPPAADPFDRTPPDRTAWPDPPAGRIDAAGAFSVTGRRHDAVARRAAQLGHGLGGRPGHPAGLVAQITADLWDGAYAVLWSPDAAARRAAARVFFARLDRLDARLAQGGPFLHGAEPRADDVLLAAVLLTYDAGWRAGFPPAAGAVAHFPHLWDSARRLVARAGAAVVVPDDFGRGPWGALPPIPGLDDPGAAWLDPAHAGLPARARSGDARPTPYSGDWPASSRADRDTLWRVVTRLAAGPDGGLGRRLREDLGEGAWRLAQGAPALTQTALRRTFWARLAWLDHRVTPLGPAARGHVVRTLVTGFPALRRVFPPIDPDLADFPHLAALAADLDPA
ncbi:MAG: GNAT family N-acetyltransferase [Propionibacteriaceae bacterium]|jgi:putative glutathione S-transferase|nr:GNAT family N-acetyltransferase [Propionibacteriaceae bacterium]